MPRYENATKYLKIHDRITPRCTTKAQYNLWRDMPPPTHINGFCEDCTPEYQKEMCDCGRCDHPEVLFYLDKEGMIYGAHILSDTKVAL